MIRNIVTLGLLLSWSVLAQTLIDASYEGNTLSLQADTPIQYSIDYAENTIVLPGSQLAEPRGKFPTAFKIKLYPDDIHIEIAGPFQVSLSPDQRVLSVSEGQDFTAPIQIAEDERAPVMYFLSNADPNEVASLLSSLYGNLQVEVDQRQRALLVLVNPEDRSLVDEMVTSLDTARPQVMFEAEILEINQDITQSLGIQYDSIFTFNLTEGAPPSIASLGPVTRAPLSLTFGVNVLKTTGAAEVLARPRVTTLDGIEAQLNATQTVPVVVPGSNGQESIQNITTGITLTMLPRISPNGMVEADLSISVSTPTGTTSQGVPQFSSRDASTTVRVANGQPIAIGGLLEQRSIEGKQKVPLLGDIPLLGALFTSTRTEQRETDLVIIVTPRIIDLPRVSAP